MHLKKKLLIYLLIIIFITGAGILRTSNKANADSIKIPNIDARCAVAVDGETKRVLYAKNAKTITPMASTTKIMTSLVALNYGDLDKKFEISSKAASIRGSTVGYKKGELITLRELLYGLMLRSGNDAAIAISEGISGSVEEFMKLMNEYASGLGMLDTHFESPHGLDSQNHYTTAYDLALITLEAKKTKEFNKIVATKDISTSEYGFTRSYHNINKILWQIPTANGVKTGYTGQAGKCLVTSVDVKGHEVAIVTINCPKRWEETKEIYDYLREEYEYVKVASQDEILKELEINNGKNKLRVKSLRDIYFPLRKEGKLETKVIVASNVHAPIAAEEQIGILQIYENGNIICKKALNINESVEKKIFRKKIFKIIKA